MRTKHKFTLVAISAMLLGGCGGGEESADDKASDAIGGLDSAMTSFTGDVDSISMDVVTKEFQKQLDAQESQLEAAKATAKSYDDGPLNTLISNLDSKIVEARSLLGKLSKSGSNSSLQDELASLMKELPALYNEIKTKINVLGG